MKILLSLFMFGLIGGCSSDKGSDDSKNGYRNPQGKLPTSGDGTNNPRICQTNKVIELLDNRNTIISQASKDIYKFIVWDHKTLNKINEIDRSKSYHRLSPSGEYILRKVSERNYQLENLGENSSYNVSLKYTGSVKSVQFSSKSDYIIGTSRTRGLSDNIALFDILKKEKVFEATLDNIKYTSMNDSDILHVASGFRYYNYLNSYNMANKTNESFRLRSGELRWLGISKSIALAKIDYRYYAYDLQTQKNLYNIKIRAVYDYNYETDLALISKADYNQIHILDMQTGIISQSLVRPDNIYISTCRFTENTTVLVCRSKSEVNKVVLWDTAADTTKEVCY